MSYVNTTYGWTNAHHTGAHEYTLPEVLKTIQKLSQDLARPLKILDLGCGNGAAAAAVAELDHEVVALDASSDGVEIARSTYPGVRFEVASVYDSELTAVVGEQGVDCIISLDVVEHLYFPNRLFHQSHLLLRPGGQMIVSTPYHGYLKNLALSLANGWDNHFEVTKDGGHIKFFSKATLSAMALGAGMKNPRFTCVGRMPFLWKAMILVVER